MKQILRYSLVALLAMVFGNVMAEEATLKYSGTETTNMKADGSNEAATVGLDENAWSVVAAKGAASNAPGLNKAGDIRLYYHKDGSNTITVSSLTNATISSIAITFTGDNYSNASVTVNGNAVTGTDGVYEINSTSFVLGNANTSNAQVRISQIVITYAGGTPVSVLPPKFSIAGGSFYEPVTVALSCETEGARILYTIPAGQDPEYTDDENYSGVFYDGTPLTISRTTTIKAMAVKNGQTSSIVGATYTIVELDETSVASALELVNGLADGATSADVYKVKGFVISVTEINTQFGNATFVIADSKDATTGLTVFRVNGPHNESITDGEIIKVGDQVAVLGKLKKYVKDEVVTPEVVDGYIFSINEPTPTTDTWTVAGTLPLVNKSWDPSDESADMTTTDGVIFTYVKEDITLEKDTNYEFKVVKNHAWGEEYPSSNYVVNVNETGKYKATITFNANTKEVACVTEKTGSAGPVTHTWGVVGTLVGGWDDDVEMTKDADGLYKAVVENVAKGDYEFKVRADHAWDISYPGGDNYKLNVAQDASTVTVTFNEETKAVDANVSAATGINTAKVVELNGAVYNVAGQMVTSSYKGLVIKNGKKMIQK